MITYAMDPRHWNMSEFIELKQEEDVLEAIALSFTHRTKQAVGRGLLRGYRREEDTLNTVRGQIRFSDQIRRRYDLPLPIEVAYDEYTEDIEQNRLLKTALYRLSLLESGTSSLRMKFGASAPPSIWCNWARTRQEQSPRSVTPDWTSTIGRRSTWLDSSSRQ